jgi:hypothetical protein
LGALARESSTAFGERIRPGEQALRTILKFYADVFAIETAKLQEMASQLFERYGEVLSGAFIALVGLGILDLARSLNDRGASKPTAAFALRHDGDNVAWSSGWILIRWCWGVLSRALDEPGCVLLGS